MYLKAGCYGLLMALSVCNPFWTAAQAQTFQGTYTDTGNGNVNTAQAVFSIVTGTTTYLQVTLTNTSSFVGGYNNPDALSGLFFQVNGDPTLDMSKSSAISPAALLNPSTCATPATCSSANVNVGAEWLYEHSLIGFTATNFSGAAAHYGVASSQYSSLLPSFGKGLTSTIGTSPPSLAASGTGQLGFSLVGSNFNSGTAANSMQSLPLVMSNLVFNFALPTGTTSVAVSDVYFTYGTAPDGSSRASLVSSPEPATIALFTVGMLGLGAVKQRTRRTARSGSGATFG